MAQDQNRGPIQPIGKGDKGVDLQKELETLIHKDVVLTKQVEAGQEAHQPLDAKALAEISRNLPTLIQNRLQKLDAAQVYQTFKLAGTDYVVRDQRDSVKKETPEKLDLHEKKTIAQESKMTLEELVLQRGKTGEAKEKTYANFFADPMAKPKASEQQTAMEKMIRLFTKFEKTLLQRFEGGGEVARPTEEGRVSFLKKTAGQWRDFFSHFSERTVKRRVAVDAVENWTFRGLVKKESKTTVVSDLAMTSGQLEKFVRFKLAQNANSLAERLALLEPGSQLSKSDLKEHAAEELEFLAIKHGEGEMAFTQAPTKGKFFGTAKVEEQVASHLGLEKKNPNIATRKKKGGGSLFSESEEELLGEEGATQFVPWWQLGPLQRPKGPVRWFVIMSYIVLIAAIFFGLWYFLKSF